MTIERNTIMIRPFYRDSLDALYMAKHYGMTYEDIESSKEGDVYKVDYHLMVEGDDFNNPLSRYVIHPDSMRLLEPIDGDQLYNTCDGQVLNARDFPTFDNDIDLEKAIKWVADGTFEISRRWVFGGTPDTNLRRHFIWPEHEDQA